MLNIFRVIALVSAVSFCALGVFVYSQNRSSKLHGLYCAFMVGVGLWSLGFFVTMFEQVPAEVALLSSRLSHLFGGYTPLAYLYFAIIFAGFEGKKRVHLLNPVLTGFICIACLTPLIVKAVPSKLFFPYYPEPGPLYLVYIGNYLYNFSRALRLLWDGSRELTTDAITRKQRLSAFVGVLVAWFGVATLFLLIYNIKILILIPAYFFLPAIAVMFTHSILRYQFLDVRLILRRSLVYSVLIACITATYLVMVLIMEKWFQGFFGYRSFVATVLITFLIAVFFNPLREHPGVCRSRVV